MRVSIRGKDEGRRVRRDELSQKPLVRCKHTYNVKQTQAIITRHNYPFHDMAISSPIYQLQQHQANQSKAKDAHFRVLLINLKWDGLLDFNEVIEG